MHRYVSHIGLWAALLYLVSPLSSGAAAPSPVRISELNWAGSGRSLADEWVELANTSTDPVDVSGWALAGVATDGQAISLPDGTVIAPRDTLLIANYAPHEKSTLDVTPDLVTTAISIPNTSLSILLLMPDGTVVDSLADAGAPDFGDKTASMERDLATDAWLTATSTEHLLDGQFGTPGAPLPVAAADVAEETVTEIVTPTLSPALIPCQPVAPIAVEAAQVTEEAEDTPVEEPIVVPIEVAPVADEPVTYEPVVPEETEEVAPAAETPTEVVSSEDVTSEEIVPEETAPEATPPAMPTVGRVVLSEFVSDPLDGAKEWIEVHNLELFTVDLSAWSVRDASGKATLIASTIDPDSYVVVTSPLGKLNNDGDTIELIDANGAVVDRMTYSSADAPQDGASLGRNDETWLITSAASPGSLNTFPALAAALTEDSAQEEQLYAPTDEATSTITDTAPPAVDDVSSTSAARDATSAPTSVTIVATAKPVTTTSKKSTAKKKTASAASVRVIASIAEANEGDRVRMTGELIALPGVFGAQIAILEGATLYMNSAAWPTMQLGDRITVEGDVSLSRGEKRIKIANADDITIVDGDASAPAELTEALLQSSTAPTLVRLEGIVLSREDDLLTVDMHGIGVHIKAADGTGVRWSTLTSSKVTIVGVLRQTADGPIVMPRSTDDVTVEENVAEVVGAVVADAKPPGAAPWIGAGLLTSTIGTLGYWFARSRNLIPSFSA